MDYGIGNLGSIHNMFKKIGVDSMICKTPDELKDAKKIILPGMGNFDYCVKRFRDSGFKPILEKQLSFGIPILGICVGLQMMFETSEEGIERGLGWISGEVRKFSFTELNSKLTIPHMGWDKITFKSKTELANGLNSNNRFYFAHSYFVVPRDQRLTIFETTYGHNFSVGVKKENLIGVQFHPEKSLKDGMTFLSNFANL